MSIFTMVKNLVNARIDSDLCNGKFCHKVEYKLNLKYYPQRAIKWLISNEVINLKAVNKTTEGCKSTYEIEFEPIINERSKFFSKEYQRTLLASQKLKHNDIYRYDDNRSYSQSRVDDEYYYQDENKYIKLDDEDDCRKEWFAQSLGFNNIREYKVFMEANPHFDKEEFDFMYRNFLNKIEAKSWEQGYEEECEYAY